MISKFTKSIFLASMALLTFGNAANAQTVQYTKYVNTFIGTAPLNDPKILGYELPKDWRSWAGLTFPGSSLPNAMVQLSPMTAYGSGAGYQYEDSVILGFTHTNKGHWNLCNIPILPMTNPGSKFGSRFSHKRESSSPGYYQVYLDDYGINVSLTSTLRAGYHKYKFKNNKSRQILFDLGKANSRVTTWKIEQAGTSAVQGFQGGENVYFYAKLNANIEKLDKTDEGKRTGYAILHLADGSTAPVELKIGLSFVSVENAKQNLEAEIGNKSFEVIRKEANQKWEALLSTIQVKGGTAKQTKMFYSCLYRSFLWPALRSDINGDYTDAKHKVGKVDFNYYTEPSLWDTYRNKDVLLGLVTPKVTLNVIKSMKDVGDKTGFIPTFFHGDHGSSSIAGAYLRGIADFDIKGTYQILLRNANVEGGARPYIKEYIEKGYISDPDIVHPEVETKAKAGVSKTLEYSYDDYSVAQIAKKLGDTANYRILMARSKNYKNMFDPSTRFMRGRLDNGDWIKPFNPEQPYYEYMYREANAWQVSFFAPHDMPGLIALYGGPKKFELKLDSLFTLPWNPKYIARNVETMVGQYCQGNQPDHEAPFAYTFIGKPEKTQKVLDNILNNLYGIGDEGLELSGMDDAGEMSSWYVFSSMGLYPFSATDPKYIVTAPLFDKVTWKTSSGKILTITKPGKGRGITAIKVNGKKINGYFVSHDLFKSGGNINVVTK
ncbi:MULTISPECIES: GH92 family glycosyl hydrolase [unclassified Mucilaginibacter]|uniref:GH92 family glycosyl hydrolase n=1 Tax=unclassified Mucilaginibacter TaxID=2617802 RepID=UPI002AC9248D|nr:MULTISPECIES: GH92 family glycosyl hydrolase [unclassified Mucilaginibacter]MEB0261909.1 GH92 family glycosyl hydrolase [Mucilaginibacter sp. 10I4]MEB0277638.1 GH92 family glycosyl hydrolase [Mucilaginibacter sp. 10B2]MEB0299553.1 GH92 family glycosyl hydrolase [Mucilaginibacter sp. 5C4]WPX24735.1 GH92 family glycosyl hydrolase [Mucilaginibacter sp. 5C4]